MDMRISGSKVILEGDLLSPELEQELQVLRAKSEVFATIVKVAAPSPEKLFADALERVRLDPAIAGLSASEQARKAALLIIDEF
jgi:predicted TIM-barrel fold metal-dependent hydrolase